MEGSRDPAAGRLVWNGITVIALIVSLAAWLAAAKATFSGSGVDASVRRPVRFVPAPEPLKDPVSLEGAPMQGRQYAPLALLVFSDFECPFCATFAQRVLPDIEARYVSTGKLRVGFRHLPRERHVNACRAAEAAACADAQGQFWDMHNERFHDQASLAPPALMRRARRLALDMPAFEECMAGTMRSRIRQDLDEARHLGITGTPAFLLGRVRPDGALSVQWLRRGGQPVDVLSRAIEGLLVPEGEVR